MYSLRVPLVTIILTYATSLIKVVWSGGDETVFLSSLIKKVSEKEKQQKPNLVDSWIRTDSHTHRPPKVFATTRLSHRAIRRFRGWILNRVICVSLQWTWRRSERTIKQCHREKQSFLLFVWMHAKFSQRWNHWWSDIFYIVYYTLNYLQQLVQIRHFTNMVFYSFT